MDKETYLRFLRALLMNRVPAADAEDIVRFYTEYFEEASPEKEAEVMASLGSPEELTAKIMEQRAKEEADGVREPDEPRTRGYSAPAGNGFLPRWVGIMLVVFMGCMIVPTVGGMAIGFSAAGIVLFACGGLMIALGVLGAGLGGKLLALGGGLVMISVGSLLVQAAGGMFWLVKKAMTNLWNVLVEGGLTYHEAVN